MSFVLRKFKLFFFSNAVVAMTYAGSYAYMSPQAASREEYSKKTDVWSLGWVFYNAMTLEFPNLDPQVSKLRPNPFTVSIPNENFKLLRDCICSKMIVVGENQRGSIDDVIADVAFHEFYHSTEAKAKSWEYQEAIEEMTDRMSKSKQVQMQMQMERGDRNLQEQIDGLTKQVETAMQLVTNLTEDLDIKQVQIAATNRELRNEVEERKKLQKTVNELTAENKEIKQKLMNVEENNSNAGLRPLGDENGSGLSNELRAKLKLTKEQVDMASQVSICSISSFL